MSGDTSSHRSRGDDLTDLPWASVFDPAANVRALSAIQAQGFRAASELVDRFAEIARHTSTGERPPAPPPTDARRVPQGLSPDVDLVISTWWTVIGQMFRAMRGEPGQSGNQPARIDVATGVAFGGVCLVMGGGDAELWLDNSGTHDVEVVLRCTELLAHDGATIRAAAVRFTPETVVLPGRSGRGVAISVVAEGSPPGRYRGTIVLSGQPDAWFPVELTVPETA